LAGLAAGDGAAVALADPPNHKAALKQSVAVVIDILII
jgi:hypothetical protein